MTSFWNTSPQFARLFSPERIALIGASEHIGKIGAILLKNLIAFPGTITPVHPTKRTILGYCAYPSVSAIPQTPDVAVIAVPRQAVKAVVTECAERQVKFGILITSGFGEIGQKAEEEEILHIARDAGMRLLGPNCVGYGNPHASLNASFLRSPEPGGVSIITQSGGNAELLFAEALQGHLGIAKFVAIGNAIDIHFDELITCFADDPETTTILLYVESIGHSTRFLDALAYAAGKKPIIALKGGVSSAGRAATVSHTASLSTTADIYRTVFKQYGVLQVHTLEEMIDAANVLRLPALKGKRVAVLTNSGGIGVLATDLLEQAGLTTPPSSTTVQAHLATLLPAIASVRNPFDLTVEAPASDFAAVLNVLAAHEPPDAFFFPYSCPGYRSIEALEDFADQTIQAVRTLPSEIPFVTCNLPATAVAFKQRFELAGLPCFTTLSRGVFALKILAEYSTRRNLPRAQVSQPGQPDYFREGIQPIFAQAMRAQRTILDEEESRKVLHLAGFKIPAFRRCATLEACLSEAKELTFPLVMKISAANMTHKSDVGGVVTGIRTQEEVQTAFAAIVQNVSRHALPEEIQGVLLSEQIPPGQELLLGIKRDPLFGSFIMVGLGGIFVEVFQDVALRLAPITLNDAAAMLDELQAAPILRGIRGQVGIDRDVLLDLLVRLSQLAAQCPEIQELDINPLIALPPGQGCHVADVRVILNNQS